MFYIIQLLMTKYMTVDCVKLWITLCLFR